MKKTILSAMCFFLIASLCGCQTNNKTKVAEGAVIGGVIGAGAGGIIGHQMHRGGEGAGIGLALGVLSGALLGSQIPNQNQAAPVNPASAGATTAANPNQMSMQQIVDLSKQGIHESVIIDKIRLSNSRFSLTTYDVDNLKKQGVSQPVINAMQGM